MHCPVGLGRCRERAEVIVTANLAGASSTDTYDILQIAESAAP